MSYKWGVGHAGSINGIVSDLRLAFQAITLAGQI